MNSHLKEYRHADGDILNYLKNKCKVDDSVIESVWSMFSKKPFPTIKEFTNDTDKLLEEDKNLSEANIHKALGQISGYKI